MKERGILFTGRNVRSILDGSKTQTRRVVRLKDHSHARLVRMEYGAATFVDTIADDPVPLRVMNPWGFVPRVLADSPEKLEGVPVRLWVRESWGVPGLARWSDRFRAGMTVVYRADMLDPNALSNQWRPSIHMPRLASRITLEIVEVRVQRLQDVTEDDAKAEGVKFDGDYYLGATHPAKGTPKVYPIAAQAFASRWDEINGKRATWESNPWVWAITFKKVETTHASDARHSA